MQIGRLLSGACFVAAILARCATANAADNADAICNAVANAFDAAVVSGDPINVGATYTPDGEFVTPFGVVDGPEAIARAEASGVKPGAKAVQTVLRSRMIGDMALCIGEFTFTYATGVPGAELKGYWTRLVRKVGNDWKTEVMTYNRRLGE
jgi:ketosteroid isomerase-like protein